MQFILDMTGDISSIFHFLKSDLFKIEKRAKSQMCFDVDNFRNSFIITPFDSIFFCLRKMAPETVIVILMMSQMEEVVVGYSFILLQISDAFIKKKLIKHKYQYTKTLLFF